MIKNNSGSVVIEASVVFMVLMLILTFSINAIVNFSKEDRLKRLSYQVASLVREKGLYADGNFTQIDAQKIFLITDKLAGTFIKDPQNDLSIGINFLNFDDKNNLGFYRGECPLKIDFDYHELIQNKKNELVILSLCTKKYDFTDLGIGSSNIQVESALIRR